LQECVEAVCVLKCRLTMLLLLLVSKHPCG